MEASEIIWLFLNPLAAMRGVRDFLELGGDVLGIILIATLVLWVLIFERVNYLYTRFRDKAATTVAQWQARKEHKSWHAHRIREMLISDLRLAANRNLSYIRVLIALAPFLGLLGTVTGMVEVFDVMALTGSGNARAMAAGISKATLPTMAGMVVALSGLFFVTTLERKAQREVQLVADSLTLGDKTPKKK